jgi:hypothetical protein
VKDANDALLGPYSLTTPFNDLKVIMDSGTGFDFLSPGKHDIP